MRLASVLAAVILFASCSGRPPEVDAGIERAIGQIKVIDNHGHPLAVVPEGGKPDDEYDALVFEEMEPAPMPVRIREDNREYVEAWKMLYGYRYSDMNPEHVKELMETKRRMMREKGDAYPAWVLDQLGIETLLANRIAMGRGLQPPRFRWVAYVDALMLPFSDEQAKRQNPDYRSFYKAQERLQARHRKESAVDALPAALDGYEKSVVVATLDRMKRGGAVAVKFEAAYLRSLDIGDPPREEAAKVYARYVRGGEPAAVEYKVLQDHLFRFIARESGRLGMAVHIHLCGGAGGYYKLGGTNPTLLDGVLSDTTLRKTNFVMVHGGWPYTREVGYLLTKPHVYADISAMTFVLYPRELSEVLRSWLNLVPERVLYGGDVEPFYPQINWEETGWLTVTTGRKALALALTGMIRDGEVTRERALQIARLVLRENAERLYGFAR
jgi:predicted TIM-barrel fold metal-dependent hydrolase